MSPVGGGVCSFKCPVCHYGVAASFFCAGDQPLATLGWAKSKDEALHMPRYSLDYVQCARCTHVYNKSFSYDAIPYANNPNRMYNKGAIWQGHLATTRDVAVSKLPMSPTVIDIGCGEGHFVRGIAEFLKGRGRFIGFDPNVNPESGVGVEFYGRYFDPLVDVQIFEPDLLIMRHVLEHLTDPAHFINQLSWGASQLRKPVYLFAEMPCIDRVLTTGRLVDFFYEHPSQFTTESFEFLMSQGGRIEVVDHGYNSEVIYGLIELTTPESYIRRASGSMAFSENAKHSQQVIQHQIKDLLANGKRVAIWGGTGKAAAFIHFFGVEDVDSLIVVDSDLEKVGTFVSKTGHPIFYRDVLKTQAADVIIIPSQWRAKDIVAEINREHIKAALVLIEHNGSLIDFDKQDHPYK